MSCHYRGSHFKHLSRVCLLLLLFCLQFILFYLKLNWLFFYYYATMFLKNLIFFLHLEFFGAKQTLEKSRYFDCFLLIIALISWGCGRGSYWCHALKELHLTSFFMFYVPLKEKKTFSCVGLCCSSAGWWVTVAGCGVRAVDFNVLLLCVWMKRRGQLCNPMRAPTHRINKVEVWLHFVGFFILF